MASHKPGRVRIPQPGSCPTHCFTREETRAPEIQRCAWGHAVGLELTFLDLLPDFQGNFTSALGPILAKADFFLHNNGLISFREQWMKLIIWCFNLSQGHSRPLICTFWVWVHSAGCLCISPIYFRWHNSIFVLLRVPFFVFHYKHGNLELVMLYPEINLFLNRASFLKYGFKDPDKCIGKKQKRVEVRGL